MTKMLMEITYGQAASMLLTRIGLETCLTATAVNIASICGPIRTMVLVVSGITTAGAPQLSPSSAVTIELYTYRAL